MDADWQLELFEIKDRGLHVLQTEKWADCHFLVGSAATNQKIFAGHKLILAMASPVFERMFYGQLADKDDPIVIPDVQPDAFFSMLEYIYSDSINIGTFDKACELCYVAKKYMLPHVVEECTRFLWSDLSPSNACRAYEFAKLFDEPRLMQSSMELIAAHTREVLADPSFTDIEMSTLMAILDQEKLNIDSELDLFNAVLRFANERSVFDNDAVMNRTDRSSPEPVEARGLLQVEEIKMEPDVNAMMQNGDDFIENQNHNISPVVDVLDTDSSAVNVAENIVVAPSAEMDSIPQAQPSTFTESATSIEATAAKTSDSDDQPSTSSAAEVCSDSNNYLMETHEPIIDEEMLKKAVRKIRFLTMTPQQFAEGPARSKILQQHEALAILINISSPFINDCPMPEGFCSSRCSRNYYEQRGNQRDMSNFHHINSPNSFSQNNGNISYYDPMDASVDQGQHQALASNRTCIRNAFGVESEFDPSRSYCVRTANPQFDYRNAGVTDCGLTFQVDTNIWITGVQVPTQVPHLMNSAGVNDRYTEILYAHIQNMQGSRLSYTHYTSRVSYETMLEVSFDRPVYIYRNQIYKVFVVFNKIGWYPMYTPLTDVICNSVKFRFNVGDPGESVSDGLIRAIVFRHPLPE